MSHYKVVATGYWLLYKKRMEMFHYFSFNCFLEYQSVSNVHKDIYVKEYKKNMEGISVLDIKLLFWPFFSEKCIFSLEI